MALTDVVRLVKSLSRVEKRQFKLATKKQAGNKDYLDLFNIIDQCHAMDMEFLKEEFRKIHPDISPDNAARYLLKILTDSLIQSKIKNDNSFQLLHGLMRVRLLQERSIPEEAYKELKRLQQTAVTSQDNLIQYMIYRKELEYITEINFKGTTEKQMVALQMKARELLKDVRNIHEHHSLYELLKHRLIYSGKVLSEDGKKKLDDLILNEIGLVTGRIKQNFESQKLHLLFQSFFFTDIGDYKSALKTFYVLNKLFEQNITLWGHPPLDYFSALDGILDSLRANEYYNEMEFYVQKLEQMNEQSYPEYFHFLVKKTAMIYRLVIFTGNKNFDAAIQHINNTNIDLLKAYSLIDDEKQSELFFYIGLIYFKVKKFKSAHKYINEIILTGKINYQSVIYRASRLLNILIHYESNNLDYLDYEIRSYNRSFRNKGRSLKTEKMVLKAISLHPNLNKLRKNELLWKKLAPAMNPVENDKYEKQLLKYFDFIGWIKNKFIHSPQETQ